MLLSAVSVLVVVQSSSENPEGLMNNSVYVTHVIYCMYILYIYIYIYTHIYLVTHARNNRRSYPCSEHINLSTQLSPQ